MQADGRLGNRRPMKFSALEEKLMDQGHPMRFRQARPVNHAERIMVKQPLIVLDSWSRSALKLARDDISEYDANL